MSKIMKATQGQLSVEQSGLPPEITQDYEDAMSCLRMAKNENTFRSYSRYWKRFQEYCASFGVSPLPADRRVVFAFLQNQSKCLVRAKGEEEVFQYSVSTINTMLSAIQHVHTVNGFDSPLSNAERRKWLKNLEEDQERLVRHNDKYPIVNEYLDRFLQAISSTEKPNKRKRDTLLFLMARQGGFRRSEICNLKLDDCEILSDRIKVYMRHTKRSSELSIKVLPRDEPYSCYDAFVLWEAIIKGHSSRLFVPIRKNDTISYEKVFNLGEGKEAEIQESRFSPNDFYRQLKRYCLRAELSPEKFSAHCMRSGLATQWHNEGKDTTRIKRRTLHKSLTSLDRYIKVEPD